MFNSYIVGYALGGFYYYIVDFTHSTIVGGSSKNGSVSFDISMYATDMAALKCLKGCVY
jgi:hypothetical protein